MNRIIDGVGKVLHKGFITIRRIVVMIKGQERNYELIDINGAVAGVVIDSEGKIGLVHQFRPAIGRVVAEIPAGTRDKKCAGGRLIIIGELEEEMHINQQDIITCSFAPIIDYYMMAGCCNGTMEIYLIKIRFGTNVENVNDGDVIRTEWVNMRTFGRYIEEGLIVDAASIMAYWYLRANPHLLTSA